MFFPLFITTFEDGTIRFAFASSASVISVSESQYSSSSGTSIILNSSCNAGCLSQLSLKIVTLLSFFTPRVFLCWRRRWARPEPMGEPV